MKIVTFGEIMLRLAPNGYYRFFQDNQLEATFGGGEANVAVSLSNYGMDAAFVTKLPTHDIGQGAINDLRGLGVDTSKIVRGGERVGIYYLEKGASQRASNVIYDRAYSALALAKREDFNWEEIFEDVTWFHFTGITPALGENVAEITLDAVKKAQKMGVKVSCDLNYRKKLWSEEKAKETMISLAPYIDLLIANEEDSEKVFGITSSGTDVDGGELNHDGYLEVARKLTDTFGFETVAITLRESITANDNKWSALLFENGQGYFSTVYDLHIVDRVGGGDSFGGGLIYAKLNGYKPQHAIEFAVAASALKHSIEGDYNRVSLDEVNNLVQGDGTGRVQR
ncbi:MAG TPA: sugar kinase [Erysipelothrix sp.]|nr:sugar kinase [Erysipelothrix sp.]